MSALINFYAHFAQIEQAIQIFRDFYIRQKNKNFLNITTLNALLKIYFDNDMNNDCLQLFDVIQKHKFLKNISSVFEDVVTFYSMAIKCCTEAIMIDRGQQIHQTLLKSENREIYQSMLIQIQLIHMYAKFGDLTECESIFIRYLKNEKRAKRDIKIWNTMIYLYGANGNIDRAKQIFFQIVDERSSNVCADYKTFALIINACYQGGDFEEAINIWTNFINDPEIKGNEYIISSLIRCFSANGQLNKAKELVLEFQKPHNLNESFMMNDATETAEDAALL